MVLSGEVITYNLRQRKWKKNTVEDFFAKTGGFSSTKSYIIKTFPVWTILNLLTLKVQTNPKIIFF